MDMEWVKFGFQVLQFLLTGGIGIYVYLSNKDKVTNDRIGKLESDLDTKLDGHIERIVALETKSESSLTHNDLADIHEKINKIGSDISSLSGKFTGVSNLLDTLHNYLLRGAKQ
jgi:hypothetical protein